MCIRDSLYSFNYKKTSHALINLFFTICTAIIGFGLAFLLLKSTDFVSQNKIGLIHFYDIPLFIQVLMSLLILDFGAYLVHFIEHKVPWMWKFHLVHHSDMNVDVTTGLRHHPGEIIFRITFTILSIYISGASIGMVMLYQSLSVLFAHITHANINLPKKVDNFISLIFVTPHMHKIHHHYKQPLTDTNYGNIFLSIFFPIKKNLSIKNITKINLNVVKKVIKKHINEKINIKLPNDILINQSKICGILQEIIFKNNIKYIIIGVGINLNNSPIIPKYCTSYLNLSLIHI